MSDIAPAIYEADKYYQVPCMTDPDYMAIIFNICRKEKVTAVLSLIDPELSLNTRKNLQLLVLRSLDLIILYAK